MVIVFANQKGGCGKTTHCIQFANYIATKKNIDTLVLDLDFQRSIQDRRDADINIFDNPAPYEILSASIDEAASILKDVSSINGNLLIDLPGKIDDNSLKSIFQAADIIICPFKYDKLTMDSTGFFIRIMQALNIKAKMFFLPNNINKAVRYDTKKAIVEILQECGYVTADIPNRVAMERVSTYSISEEAVSIVEEAYEYIIQEGQIK